MLLFISRVGADHYAPPPPTREALCRQNYRASAFSKHSNLPWIVQYSSDSPCNPLIAGGFFVKTHLIPDLQSNQTSTLQPTSITIPLPHVNAYLRRYRHRRNHYRPCHIPPPGYRCCCVGPFQDRILIK